MKRTFYIIVIFCLLAGMLGLASPANADTTAGQKKFLPVAHYNKTYVVTGVVTDSAGRPVAGVTVFSDGNRSGVTDETGGFRIGGLAPGEHQLAAAHDGYRFTPSEATLSVAAEDVVQNFSAQAVCADKIINGDFEGQLNNPTGWNIEPTQIPAVFTTDLAHTASNSAFLGFDNPIPGVNRYGHSQVSQIVDIPAGAESVMMHA